jgi:DNA-binding YbaB/EbfC family protein
MVDLDIASLMQQAQQMRQQMDSMQKGLATKEVQGSAGSGLVVVKASGDMRIKSVELKPEALQEDREMVQDLIVAAVNQALEQAKSLSAQQMAGIVPPGLLSGFPGF